MIPDLLDEGLGEWFGPLVCMWLFSSYMTCRTIGERHKWKPIQTLQVYRSVQCALFAGVGNRHELELQHHREIGSGLVQLVYRPT